MSKNPLKGSKSHNRKRLLTPFSSSSGMKRRGAPLKTRSSKQARSRLALKAKKATPSLTLIAKELVKLRRQQGLPVFDFGLGEAKGEVDIGIVEAGIEALRNNSTGYVDPAGLPELRDQILQWLQFEPFYSQEEVIVSIGAKQALYLAILTICNPGDVLLLDAAPWVSYAPMVEACSAKPVRINPRLGSSNFMKMTPSDLLRELKKYPNAKGVIINSPCNPTGQIYEQSELEEILDICVSNNIFMIFDRLYWKTYFERDIFPEPKITKERKEWLITLDGFSKNWRSVGGLRVGWAVGPKDIIGAMVKLQSHITSGTSTVSQYACLSALKSPYLGEMQRDLAIKRNHFYEEINKIPLVQPFPNQGGFYCFWDVTKLLGMATPSGFKLKNSDDVASYLLTEAGVVTLSGRAFEMDGYLRTCFHIAIPEIQSGLKAAAQAITRLSR